MWNQENLVGKWVEVILYPEDGGDALTVRGKVVDVIHRHSITVRTDEGDTILVRPPFDLFLED